MYRSLQPTCSSVNNTYQIKEQPSLTLLRLKYLCKPTYKPRLLRNKGAILLLLWNILVFSAFAYLGGVTKSSSLLKYQATLHQYHSLLLGLLALFCPLLGWLTDVYIGRYRIIHASLWTLWLSSIGAVLMFLIDYELESRVIREGIFPVLYIVMAIGAGGYLSSVMQFGIDQLTDGSTGEMMSYIYWSVWSIYASNVVITVFLHCVKNYSQIMKPLFIAFASSLALISNSLFHHWLVVEPVGRNPLKLILQILKYSKQNKYPRLRSAFTYWENKPPSRLDLAKTKYGGPFTTEEVEDVKTFFRITCTIMSAAIFVSVIIATWTTHDKFVQQFSGYNETGNCFEERSIASMGHYCVMFFIPLHELVLHPLFYRCLPNITSLQKFSIGMFFTLGYLVSAMVFEKVGSSINNSRNITGGCFLNEIHVTESIPIDYHWVIVPGLLQGFASIFLLIALFEFVTSQSPYSMKGLVLGIAYAIIGLFATLCGIVLLQLHKIEHYCGFWYYLTSSLIIVVSIILFCFVAKWYKQRTRDEPHNDHLFVEQYYDRYTSEK